MFSITGMIVLFAVAFLCLFLFKKRSRMLDSWRQAATGLGLTFTPRLMLNARIEGTYQGFFVRIGQSEDSDNPGTRISTYFVTELGIELDICVPFGGKAFYLQGENIPVLDPDFAGIYVTNATTPQIKRLLTPELVGMLLELARDSDLYVTDTKVMQTWSTAFFDGRRIAFFLDREVRLVKAISAQLDQACDGVKSVADPRVRGELTRRL
jgi:hypothetical protein